MKKIYIRDSIHGDIIIEDEVIKELIDSPEFQKLRRISQLSGASWVFPNATHNRFSHSLGVYHLIREILKKDEIQKYYNTTIQKKKLELVLIAGLLHDIGHGPFSHTFEKVYKINKSLKQKHEYYSSLIITCETSNINKILKYHNFSSEDIIDICNIIEGKYKKDPILSSLVSSQIDADRMDYLLRDSKFTGAGYGYVDTQWIIRNIKFDFKKKEIYFPYKAKFALENYLIGRFHMHEQVYYHPISTGFDKTFQKLWQRLYDLYNNGFHFMNNYFIMLLKPLLESNIIYPIKAKDFLFYDDYFMMQAIISFIYEKDKVLSFLASSIVNRNFFRETKVPIEELNDNIRTSFGEEACKYLIYKQESKSSESNLYSKNEKQIYVEDKNGERINLSQINGLEYLNSKNNYNKKLKKVEINNIYFTIRKED